jgi:hypothetical protein
LLRELDRLETRTTDAAAFFDAGCAQKAGAAYVTPSSAKPTSCTAPVDKTASDSSRATSVSSCQGHYLLSRWLLYSLLPPGGSAAQGAAFTIVHALFALFVGLIGGLVTLYVTRHHDSGPS